MAISAISVDSIWKIYYYIAIFSTILFVLKLILFSLTGGDSEVVTDFNTEMETDVSFNFFSIQSILAFLMGFGWMGYAGLKQLTFSQSGNFIVAFAVGFIFMFISSALLFTAKKLEKNVKKDKTTAIGKTGRAYTSMEPNAIGQVEIDINGQLSVVNAKNETNTKINAFDTVKVVRVIEGLLYVEKI